MRFGRAAGLVLLMLASGGVDAQQVGSKTKKLHPVAKKTAVSEAATLRAQREAEARAKTELAAQQRAEAEVRKQAEIEAREKPLRDADELIKSGKPGDAYALLEPLEFERSGEVRFDYLIGIAALDSGKPDKATLAFERVLAVDPNFAGARLDMARAYYQLGDLARAKVEFETVLKAEPPEAARATIQKYLAAIDTRLHALDTRVTAYVEGTIGHDTNVNNATAQTQIAVPALGNMVFVLNPSNQKTADSYLGLNGGLNVSHPVNETVSLYAGADVRQRSNSVLTRFDSLSLDGRAGGVFKLGEQDSLRAGILGGQYNLNGQHNRDSLGVNGEWNHVFSPANQMSVFLQQMAYRFVDAAMKPEDFDQSVLGAGWRHVLHDGKSAIFSSLFYGDERDVAPVSPSNLAGGRTDGGKQFIGLRVGGQAALSETIDVFANAGGIDGNYARTNVLFQVKRHDVLTDMTIGSNWHWDKLWTLRPQLSWSRNQSNISLYGYDRIDASVTVRRDFN
ncbi:MAG TPA: tetratricopeptide repeat protein [Gallionella sp.]|nr:tetratricopeptide repeat protein [Gallionella sp.]